MWRLWPASQRVESEEATRSYYTGKHAIQYNTTWKRFLGKTLDAACRAVDVQELNILAQEGQIPLRTLDAGCGTGLLLKRLLPLFPSAEWYGIDASNEMLAQAHQLLPDSSSIHLAQTNLSGEARAGIPYPPAFFSLLTCTNTLHYLREPVAILKGFKDLLVEGGQLVLEDYVLRGFPLPWQWFEWIIPIYDPQHQSLFSLEEARRLCREAGLHVTLAQTFSIDLFCQGWVIRALPYIEAKQC